MTSPSGGGGGGGRDGTDGQSARQRRRRRPRYEQLGAPTVLYRHLPSYTRAAHPPRCPRSSSSWGDVRHPRTKALIKAEEESLAKRQALLQNEARSVQEYMSSVNRSKMRHHGALPQQLAHRYEYDPHHPSVLAYHQNRSKASAASDPASRARAKLEKELLPKPPQPVDRATRREREQFVAPEYCAPMTGAMVQWGMVDEIDPSNSLGLHDIDNKGTKSAVETAAETTRESASGDNSTKEKDTEEEEERGKHKERKRRCKFYGMAENEADEELVVPSACRVDMSGGNDVLQSPLPSPSDYGNCLVVLPCRCRWCAAAAGKISSADGGDDASRHHHPSGWFVVHPTGTGLEEITVSRLQFPTRTGLASARANTASARSKERTVKATLNLGERILQLAICGSGKGWDCNSAARSSEGDGGSSGSEYDNDTDRRLLAIRTYFRCVIVEVSWREDSGDNGGDDVDESTSGECCGGGDYSLTPLTEIDFFARDRALNRRSASLATLQPTINDATIIQDYAPIHMATSPSVTGTSPYAPTTLAIVSHMTPPSTSVERGVLSSEANPKQNVIHHVVVQSSNNNCFASGSPPSVKQYSIPNLRHISQVEFALQNPTVLWTAARSSTMHYPSIHHKVVSNNQRRPVSGRGTNLYSLDMRCCEASLVFNPSHAKRMVEGLHSISSILPDVNRMHCVYVQSLSAASTWEIDDRMPGRSVCSWTLPGLCDDMVYVGRQQGGVFGWGSIMTQPTIVDRYQDRQAQSPLLGVSKSQNVGRFGLYQRPEVYPRFATQTLECSSMSNNSGNAGFAVSSSFSLPDVGDDIFNCGLVAFRTGADAFLEHKVLQGLYGKERSNINAALCVISLTNKGDLYGNVLLECEGSAPRMARSFKGLPNGCCAVPVPPSKALPSETSTSTDRSDILPWNLQNTFPVPNSAIMPWTDASSNNVRSFVEFDRSKIPSNFDSREPPKKRRARNSNIMNSPIEDKPVTPSASIPRTQFEIEKSRVNGAVEVVKAEPQSPSARTSSTRTLHYKLQSSAAPITIHPSHTTIMLDDEKSRKLTMLRQVGRERDTTCTDEGSDDGNNAADLSASIMRSLKESWGASIGENATACRKSQKSSLSSDEEDYVASI